MFHLKGDVHSSVLCFFAKLSPTSSQVGLTSIISTLLHFEIYQCLLISYKLILFEQKQEQQQPVIDFENGVIVKIYKS